MTPEPNSVFSRAIAPTESTCPIPRALLVFAHPDDETIALGGRLPNFVDAHLVHVTDGAPRNEHDSRQHGFASLNEYRKARATELCRVLGATGLAGISRECLRIPDQEASYHLALLTAAVRRILRQHRPEVVFTHPYEGGHPDHDATAFAVHHAFELLRDDISAPVVIETPFYHSGANGFQTGTFLPAIRPVMEVEFRLSKEELERKRHLLELFTTQAETLSNFPIEFERFRVAPAYDFGSPPHCPPVLYDTQPWGMSSAQFVSLARQAEASLASRIPVVCR